MDTEFNALLQNQTWRLVSPPKETNVIGSKWVFRIKRKSDGTIDRYKARLVAKGFNQVGFRPSKIDVSLFIFDSGQVRAYVLVYVDDILLLGNSSGMVQNVMTQLSTTFRIRDLGKPRFFLGIEATYTGDGLMLSQQRYMLEVLRKAGMETCKPLSTPMEPASSTPAVGSPPLDDPTPYRCLVGSLMYLLITRPDLSFSVNRLYSDWAGCSLDWKSTVGYAVFLGPNLVSWTSRKQRTVARSSTEAEYKALADVAAEVT
ncbi:PREDICTED: uncharacterized protein LOC109169121 [Ipomoea nil]|uniref:uncharacterized protein LOC109169121 n=1 Tax=Ipomoea nil TaxID=35883 RepID=UPI000900FDD2|nr:PREDICTED: uncharacterized protein LOC109169121 [Ipomoea nil]